MKTGLSQTATLRQDLRINPRLYQAMDMLYMPMMDLQLHLKQELLINPFLELVEPEEEEATAETPTKEEEKEKTANENETDWEEILLNGFEVPGGVREEYEHKEYTEPVSVETTDLIDHFREQLQMMVLTPRQALLSEEFLGNIKEDGYLAASVEEIQRLANEMLDSYAERNRPDSEEELAEAGDMDAEPEPEPKPGPPMPYFTAAEVEEMLGIVQRLDPAGVAARDLRECLLLQLRELKETNTLTYRLVAEAFPDLIAHRWNDLGRRFGVEPAAVQAAADLLAKLDPKPGLKYSAGGEGYVIPDLIVERGEEAVTATITEISWRGMRCRVAVKTSATGLQVDLRLNWKQAASSIVAALKELGRNGEASLAVSDDKHEGAAASVVVSDASGRVLDYKPTTVGEEI